MISCERNDGNIDSSFLNFDRFIQKSVDVEKFQRCGLCHSQFNQKDQGYVSEEMLTAYHEKCAKTTTAYQESKNEGKVAQDSLAPSFHNLYGYDHKRVTLSQYPKCGLCHSQFNQGDQGYVSEEMRTAYHEKCAKTTRAFKEWQNPGSIPIESDRSLGFFYRNRYKIAMLVLGISVAVAVCWEYMKKTTVELRQEFCLVPNNEKNSLYCTVTDVLGNVANQLFYRFQAYPIWQNAGEPPLTFAELPPHDREPPRVLASWTTHAAQRLSEKILG